MGVDIPVEMVRGVANFDGKELRQKIKAHLAEKGEEITTGKKSEESEKIIMNNLDWGKTTEERNKNLEKYNFLKTESEKESFKKELKGEGEVSEKDRATIKNRMESKLKERDQDYKNQKS